MSTQHPYVDHTEMLWDVHLAVHTYWGVEGSPWMWAYHEVYRLPVAQGQREIVAALRYGTNDIKRMTLGGLEEAHATAVANLRAGEPLWWKQDHWPAEVVP